MFYPGLVGLTCKKCQAYHYDYKPTDPLQKISTAEIVYEKKNGKKTDNPLPRPVNTVPPCSRCPKGNPIEGETIEKEIPKAQQLLAIYNQCQATNGKYLPDEEDTLLSRNLGIVNDMVEQKRQYTIAESILPLLFK